MEEFSRVSAAETGVVVEFHVVVVLVRGPLQLADPGEVSARVAPRASRCRSRERGNAAQGVYISVIMEARVRPTWYGAPSSLRPRIHR